MKPDTVNAEKRTVDVVWSAGAKVLRSSWDGPFYEELDMKGVRLDRLNNGAPFLPDHNSSRVAAVLGVVEPGSARVLNGEGICTVRFPKPGVDPAADMVFEKIRDGVIANVSVGYRSHRIEKIVTEGEKVPTFMVRDWTPFEVSAVAMGADDTAGFRSSAEETNEVEIVEITNNRGESSVTQEQTRMDPEQLKKEMEAKFQAELAKRAEEDAAKRAAEVLKERERNAGIVHACRTAKLDQTFADKLIAGGTSLDAARELVINELAKRSDAIPTDNHVRVTAVEGQDERDKFVRGVSAWAFEASGNGLVKLAKQRGIAEFAKDEIDGAQFRGMSISDIARVCLERSGVSTKGIYDKRKLFDLALRASTGDFAVLFENVMYKTLRAAYATQEDTWRRWCGTDTVKDFRAANRFLNGAFSGALPVVPEDGEYTHRSIPDGEKVSITTETRGQIISLSRQAMINDDMGALVDVAARFGRQAGKSIEIAAYELLAQNANLGPTMSDASPFYDDTARDNVSTTAALTVAAIDADRIKFRQQTFGDDYLDLRPSILLLPVGLESAARIINESAFDHTAAGDSNKPNPVRGLFSDIISSPRLVSTTRRFLFDPSKSAFKVVFLEGSGEGPTMESEEGFSRDGVQWKARIDFKVNPYDPRTTVTNAG